MSNPDTSLLIIARSSRHDRDGRDRLTSPTRSSRNTARCSTRSRRAWTTRRRCSRRPCGSPPVFLRPTPSWRGSSTGSARATSPRPPGWHRAIRDLQRAKDSGRLTFDDPTLAIACTGGALLGVLHLSLVEREPSAIDRAADGLAVNLLRMFGLSDSDAREIVARPLPRTS
jgi:hypothetical protein